MQNVERRRICKRPKKPNNDGVIGNRTRDRLSVTPLSHFVLGPGWTANSAVRNVAGGIPACRRLSEIGNEKEEPGTVSL
jgi:hypothetical protein